MCEEDQFNHVVNQYDSYSAEVGVFDQNGLLASTKEYLPDQEYKCDDHCQQWWVQNKSLYYVPL